eukprot:7388365-Pyramimonas_sp.AAC.1
MWRDALYGDVKSPDWTESQGPFFCRAPSRVRARRCIGLEHRRRQERVRHSLSREIVRGPGPTGGTRLNWL